MLKNISRLECTVNDRNFQFTCDTDCSTQLIKHAFIKFIRYVDEVEEINLKKQELEENKIQVIDHELEIKSE